MTTDFIFLVLSVALLGAAFLFERRRPGTYSIISFCALAASGGMASSAILSVVGGDWLGLSAPGIALLAVGAIFALLALIAYNDRLRDLTSVLSLISALLLGAAVVYLLDGTKAAIVYALLAVLLGALADHVREPRLQIGAIAFLAAAAVHAIAIDASPHRILYSAHPATGLAAVAAVMLAAFSLSRYTALDYLRGDALDQRLADSQWRLRLVLPWLAGIYTVYGLAQGAIAVLVAVDGDLSTARRVVVTCAFALLGIVATGALEGYRRLQFRRESDSGLQV
jgi:hypothetical protein